MRVARKSVLGARQEWSVAVPESPPWRHPGSSLVQSVTVGEFPQNGLYASIRKHVVVVLQIGGWALFVNFVVKGA